MRGDRRQLWRGLDTLACFWRRRNLTIYLRISLRTTAGLLFDFCHRFVQIGKRFSTDNLIAICWLTRRLSLLSPHSSTPSSTLNYNPMLAHSRTTTEQRFRMDDLELGNDSGSLLASRIDGFLPKQEGAYADGLNALDWINTDWKKLWTRRRTRIEGGQGRRLRRASLTRLPVLLTGSKSLPWTLTTWTQSWSNRRCWQLKD